MTPRVTEPSSNAASASCARLSSRPNESGASRLIQRPWHETPKSRCQSGEHLETPKSVLLIRGCPRLFRQESIDWIGKARKRGWLVLPTSA